MTGKSAVAVFRILIRVEDLAGARRFYQSLLRTRGRTVAPGRVYFDCGPVILGLLDAAMHPGSPGSVPTEAIYFRTSDLEGAYRRARRLGCLATGRIHGNPAQPMGEIVVRPWAERSFYAQDPAGNPLCFVDHRTVFTGTPGQVRALAGPRSVRRGTGRRRARAAPVTSR